MAESTETDERSTVQRLLCPILPTGLIKALEEHEKFIREEGFDLISPFSKGIARK